MIRSILLVFVLLYLHVYIKLLTPVDKSTITVKEVSKVKLAKVDYSIYPLYDTRIYSTVMSYGYSDTMARLIVAQARHETGTYKSKLFRKANNAFGLVKHKGDTIALPVLHTAEGRLAYAGYRSLEESTQAVLLFLTKRKCPFNFTNVKDYSQWLKKINYYEASEELYTAALKIHYKAVTIYQQYDKIHYENYHCEHRTERFRLHYCLQWKLEHTIYQRGQERRSLRIHHKAISKPLV